jgi:hypothetical protein
MDNHPVFSFDALSDKIHGKTHNGQLVYYILATDITEKEEQFINELRINYPKLAVNEKYLEFFYKCQVHISATLEFYDYEININPIIEYIYNWFWSN